MDFYTKVITNVAKLTAKLNHNPSLTVNMK